MKLSIPYVNIVEKMVVGQIDRNRARSNPSPPRRFRPSTIQVVRRQPDGSFSDVRRHQG